MTIIQKAATAEVGGVHERADPDGIIRKAASLGKTLGGEFVISDDSVDRAGDVIDQSGWKLDRFKQNPIALFNHNSDFPIGKWKDIKREGSRTLARLELAADGTSARINELRALVEQDILRAASVGFKPIKVEPIKGKSGYRFLENDLLEVSLVSVPANGNALQVAKSLNISDETMSLAFGEHAGEAGIRRRDIGEHAASPLIRKPKMSNLSQRIEDAQKELVASRDKLVELSAAEDLDYDAIEELNSRIDAQERSLEVMKASEAKLAGMSAKSQPQAPAVARRPLSVRGDEVSPADLVVRSAVVHLLSHVTGQKNLDVILEQRYPGHEATAVVTKADMTIGTTTVAGWASELINTATGAFINTLKPTSVLPDLMSMGTSLVFNNGQGAIKLPSRAAGTNVNGSFVLEGAPIPVRRIATTSVTLVPHKMGVISAFSRELAKYSTPAIEALIRSEMAADTAVALDSALLDATAGSTTRPAGLLNGVAAAAVGSPGGDHQAFLADLAALLAPFDNANAGRSLALIMHPAQRRSLAMMPGPDGTFSWQQNMLNEFRILTSTAATAGRLIAVDTADFAAAYGGLEFDVSEQATLHMEDTTPLEIVAGAPTTADPVRSLYQTASIAVRMLLDVTWAMRRTGMVQWINGTSY